MREALAGAPTISSGRVLAQYPPLSPGFPGACGRKLWTSPGPPRRAGARRRFACAYRLGAGERGGPRWQQCHERGSWRAGPGPHGARPVPRDRPAAARARGPALEGRRRLGRVDVGRLRRPGVPRRRGARRPRRRPGRPGRADDAQPARVPRRRRRGPPPRRHAHLDLQLLGARAGPVPGIRHCGAECAILEDVDYLERFLKVRDELPTLSRSSSSRTDGRAPDDVHALGRPPRRRAPRPRRGVVDRPARRPRDRHLHVGDDRPAQGRDARPREHRAGRSRACAAAASTRHRGPTGAGWCRTSRWPTSRSA